MLMRFNSVRKAALAVVAASFVVAAPALAQRTAAYASARAEGQVGEKMDGYLGIVGTPSPALRAMVDDLNIKRRAVYADKAPAASATIECRNACARWSD